MPLSATFSDVVDAETIAARNSVIVSYGFDLFGSPIFWEHWVAQQVAGVVTSHKSDHDVAIDEGRGFRFEVKFSRSFMATFDNGSRPVFKWARTKPQISRAEAVHLLILIGVDLDASRLWTWAIDPSVIGGRTTTVTVPSARKGGSKGSEFDEHAIPAYDLLPALLRLAPHLTYDAAHHQKNAARTRRSRLAQIDLVDMLEASNAP